MEKKWVRFLLVLPLLLGELVVITAPAMAQGNTGKEPGRALKLEKDSTHDKKVRFFQRILPHTTRKTHEGKGKLNPHTRGMSNQQEKQHTYILKFKHAE